MRVLIYSATYTCTYTGICVRVCGYVPYIYRETCLHVHIGKKMPKIFKVDVQKCGLELIETARQEVS